MKKAVFFDIDGTLWDEKRRIPNSTTEAVRSLRKNGNYAFICSGRSKANIHAKELLEIGFDGILAGCGTYVEFQNEVIFEEKLSQKKIEYTLAVLKKYHLPVVLEGSRCIYLDFDQLSQDSFVLHMKETLGENLLPIRGNEGRYDINKMSANYTTGDLPGMMAELQEEYEMLVHESTVVEMVPKGFSKGTGIMYICEYLDISREDTFAFGDSVNDLEMLTFAAHGIAMGNGTKPAKEAADYVTKPLAEDGIYHGLKHFALI